MLSRMMRPVSSVTRSLSESPASAGLERAGTLAERTGSREPARATSRPSPSASSAPSISSSVSASAAEGRDLDDLSSEKHVCQTEAAADQSTVTEQLFHLFRQRIRGHVEVFRLDSQQQVAHAAADEERHEARIPQLVQNTQGVR